VYKTKYFEVAILKPSAHQLHWHLWHEACTKIKFVNLFGAKSIVKGSDYGYAWLDAIQIKGSLDFVIQMAWIS